MHIAGYTYVDVHLLRAVNTSTQYVQAEEGAE